MDPTAPSRSADSLQLALCAEAGRRRSPRLQPGEESPQSQRPPPGRISAPGGVLAVAPDQVTDWLGPLPVEALHGIGPRRAAALRAYGIHRIGLLAAIPAETVQRLLGGRAGRTAADRARGIDPRPVTPPACCPPPRPCAAPSPAQAKSAVRGAGARLGSGGWRRRFRCFTGPRLRGLVPGKVLVTPFARREVLRQDRTVGPGCSRSPQVGCVWWVTSDTSGPCGRRCPRYA